MSAPKIYKVLRARGVVDSQADFSTRLCGMCATYSSTVGEKFSLEVLVRLWIKLQQLKHTDLANELLVKIIAHVNKHQRQRKPRKVKNERN